jgi:hypothetical protein
MWVRPTVNRHFSVSEARCLGHSFGASTRGLLDHFYRPSQERFFASRVFPGNIDEVDVLPLGDASRSFSTLLRGSRAAPLRTARCLAATEGRARFSDARSGRVQARAVDRYQVAERGASSRASSDSRFRRGDRRFLLREKASRGGGRGLRARVAARPAPRLTGVSATRRRSAAGSPIHPYRSGDTRVKTRR